MLLSKLDHEVIEQIATHLTKARRILFITGAGLSADSQLPTYRGVGGLYEGADTEEGIPIEEALSGTMLKVRPALTWKHISRIEKACRDSSHNRGHEVIAEMESHFGEVHLLTQNVDGFHRKAGSSNVIDIHGDIHVLRCPRCHYREEVADYSHFDGERLPPDCRSCGHHLRPDVVLFGELLCQSKMTVLRRELTLGFDMIFSVGTSSLFPYIVEPVVQARFDGIPTVEINPGETEISKMVDFKVKAGAAVSLDRIWSRVKDLLD